MMPSELGQDLDLLKSKTSLFRRHFRWNFRIFLSGRRCSMSRIWCRAGLVPIMEMADQTGLRGRSATKSTC